MELTGMPPVGMHPHRGFNEIPYLKQGTWVGTDYWNPNGGHHPPMRGGGLQWGKVGSGIEHGAKFDRGSSEPVHGFQLWVNLPAAQKLDPPCFQDALPEALPVCEVSELVKVKTLVGDGSPIETGNVKVQYVDYMLSAGGEINHTFPPDFSTAFLYIYSGAGSFGTGGEIARKGEVMQVLAPAGQELMLKANQKSDLGALLIAGVPLREPMLQHGPFVMSTREQLVQAFREYQAGKLCKDTCDFILHTASGSRRSQVRAGRARGR
mmetsp:Transcript_87182/g.154388  ORF Transcript_87182/g.154388 Transcript_87182/m.154388 type:complete len:265 (+) Transcript_87182:131-925(+)